METAAVAPAAARCVLELLSRKPDASIALPTGSTPLGLYHHLVRLHGAGRFACGQARFFNLDEFVGLASDDARSYGAFLWHHLFHPLAIRPDQVRLLRGDAPDLAAECRGFDRAIAAAGGLDLAILGLGANGHVAFNEPGDGWDIATHEVALAEMTRRAQLGRFASMEAVPARGLTMGLGTIRAARALLLLVSGPSKAAALSAILRGTPDLNWPVTAILQHPHLTVLADRYLRERAAAIRP
jgi:glucosamine-6-phosphate deaminase